MPSDPALPSAPPPAQKPGHRSGIGLFQLLGFGLLLLFVVIMLVVMVRALILSA